MSGRHFHEFQLFISLQQGVFFLLDMKFNLSYRIANRVSGKFMKIPT